MPAAITSTGAGASARPTPQHTLGPWHVARAANGNRYIYGPDKETAIARPLTIHGSLVNGEANSRLIVAAPELLALLRDALDVVAAGIDLMHRDQLAQWGGVRGWIEYSADIVTKVEGQL